MTSRGKTLLTALLMDLKIQPDVTAQMACQAVIMGTRQLGLPMEDLREINSLLRTEFGWSRVEWEAMLKDLLLKLPPDLCVDEVSKVD